FEDGDLIVINKPAGLVVHPGPGHGKGTLVNGLLAHCGDSLSGIGGVKRPGIVHRLDRDTSGLIVVAKTDRAHQHLSEQFANHGRDGRMRRDYRAFVWGRPDHPKGMVNAPVGRSHTHRTRMAVVAEGAGRQAVTHYTLHRSWPSPDAVQPTGDAAEPLIADMTLALETGRTHQIRVHLAHIRHPVVGDPVYGAGFATRVNRLPEGAATSIAALGRQALHAMTLGFEHPESGEPMLFAAPLPDDMADVAQSLGWPRDLGNLN
ncbi:MAG: RluA family pseudouridine synthase, partial [Pseudomonadota bacterium]